MLYKKEVDSITQAKNRLQIVEDELLQLAESAMEEDTIENSTLYDVLKKNDDGDAQSTFEGKLVKAELKKYGKQTEEYELLQRVDKLMAEKTALAKKIKNDEEELTKQVEDRIEKLTDSEIEELMYAKWFGTFVKDLSELSNRMLKDELETLRMLNERYNQTMDSIDNEINELMVSFSLLQQELVVI